MAITKRTDSNLSIIARAGCGKTTTIIQGVYRLMGHTQPSLLLKGSEQQEEIWNKICSGPTPSSVRLVSFGTRSVDDIKKKLRIEDKRVTVSTVHGFGMSLLNQARVCKGNYDKWRNFNKVVFLLTDFLEYSSWQALNSQRPGLIRFFKRMVGLIKADLIDFTSLEESDWYEHLERYCAVHGIEANDSLKETTAVALTPILSQCIETAGRFIDFDDMIWLPHQLNLVDSNKPTIPFVLVDEAQDLNVGQRKIILSSASRIAIVADERQAVYGFQGADVDSVRNFEEALSKRSLGLIRLPLNESRRCPQALVPFVKPIVSDFAVYRTNVEGDIYLSKHADLTKNPHPYLGDPNDPKSRVLIVARRNAFNVSMAIKFIAKEIACVILGKDFGDDLIETILKIVSDDESVSCEDALPLIHKWQVSEIRRLESIYPDAVNAVTLVEDKADCLVELCSRNLSGSVSLTIAFIRELFTDKDSTRITFSSIHKAKGLEAPTIIFLNYNECPDPKVHPSSPLYPQETNLFYVAITRTLGVLHFIESPPDGKSNKVKPCSIPEIDSIIKKLAKPFNPSSIRLPEVDNSCPFDAPTEDEPKPTVKPKSKVKPEVKPKATAKRRLTDAESVRAETSTTRALSTSKPTILPITEARQAKIAELRKQLQSLPPEDLEKLLMDLRIHTGDS